MIRLASLLTLATLASCVSATTRSSEPTKDTLPRAGLISVRWRTEST